MSVCICPPDDSNAESSSENESDENVQAADIIARIEAENRLDEAAAQDGVNIGSAGVNTAPPGGQVREGSTADKGARKGSSDTVVNRKEGKKKMNTDEEVSMKFVFDQFCPPPEDICFGFE